MHSAVPTPPRCARRPSTTISPIGMLEPGLKNVPVTAAVGCERLTISLNRSEEPHPPCATIPDTFTAGSDISTLTTITGVPAETVRYSDTLLANDGVVI